MKQLGQIQIINTLIESRAGIPSMRWQERRWLYCATRENKWLEEYAPQMTEGQSSRKNAKAGGAHRNTSFREHHRIQRRLVGIAEAGGAFFLKFCSRVRANKWLQLYSSAVKELRDVTYPTNKFLC
ncbi:hypothetical protein [uncultured Nitrosomonas sp.]|uniref:hypothetical protein n=1 Tax=uncultured Nitrosomonas sp. TaxID=156424 RepID=UPI0025FC6427|nr:hypothetical protein [uncultured Nitrosomonas sp.]